MDSAGKLFKAVVLEASKLVFVSLGYEAIPLHDLIVTFFMHIDK